MRLLSTWCLCVVLVLCELTGAARADDKEVAKAAHVEGTRLYNLGDYPAALAAFKRAYLAFESPSFLYNMAQCERQLDHNTEALRLYKSFLRTNPGVSDRDRKDLQRTIDQLETLVAAERAAKAAALPIVAPTATPTVETPAQPPTVAPQPEAIVAPAPEKPHTPIYKKWWLWTALAVVVGVGLGVGLGIALSPKNHFDSSLPGFHGTSASLRF